MNAASFQLASYLPGRSLFVPDDRGRSVQLLAMQELRGAPAQQDPRIERLADRAAATLQSAVPKRIGVLIGASFPLGMLAITAWVPSSIPAWAIAVPYMIGAGLVVQLIIRRRYRAIAPVLATLFVEEGICASCGYNLDGTTPVDNQYICPECGAAWNVNRVQRTAPIVLTSTEPLLRDQARRGWRAYINNMDRRTAKDDAGRTFSPVRVRTLRRLRKTAEGEHRAALSAAIDELAFKGVVGRVLAGLLFFAFATVTAIPNFLVLSRLRSPMVLVGFAPVIMLSLLGIAILMSDFGRSPKKVIRALRGLSLCPCCAQRIDTLTPAADGLLHCTTCFCAWKVEGTDRAPTAATSATSPGGGSQLP